MTQQKRFILFMSVGQDIMIMMTPSWKPVSIQNVQVSLGKKSLKLILVCFDFVACRGLFETLGVNAFEVDRVDLVFFIKKYKIWNEEQSKWVAVWHLFHALKSHRSRSSCRRSKTKYRLLICMTHHIGECNKNNWYSAFDAVKY